jgi:hypothetical protein
MQNRKLCSQTADYAYPYARVVNDVLRLMRVIYADKYKLDWLLYKYS